MLVKREPDIKSSEITDKALYINRRQFIISTAALVGFGLQVPEFLYSSEERPRQKLAATIRGKYTVDEKTTSYKNATNYNNFYEFSTRKEDIEALTKNFRPRPWTVLVDGHVKKSKKYDVDELIKMFSLEERISRFRCVEAWSMVVPWLGFPMADFIKRVE